MFQKRWADTLVWLHENWEGPISAADLAKSQKTTVGASLQLLRRLRAWGYVRLAQFKVSGKPGRPSHEFVLTEKGIKRAKWQQKSGTWNS